MFFYVDDRRNHLSEKQQMPYQCAELPARLALCRLRLSNPSTRIKRRVTQTPGIRRIRVVTRMKRPIVIDFDERPSLLRHTYWKGILLEIRNRPPNAFRPVKKDFPASTSSPNGVAVRTMTGEAKPQTTRVLKILNNLLGLMFMLVDQKVDVIGHDGASIAGVTLVPDHLCKSNRNLVTRFCVEFLQGMFEQICCTFIETTDVTPGWLNSFSPIMKVTEIGENITGNRSRSTTARVVG
jgi:hypothetical protein